MARSRGRGHLLARFKNPSLRRRAHEMPETDLPPYPETAAVLAQPLPQDAREAPEPEPGARRRQLHAGSWLALPAILALALLLDTWSLGQNGYANVYYSAAVRSMLESWHNLFFVAADPGGLITVDKPPVGLWAQAASASIFGFSPLSLLLPEVLAGVAAVAAIYVIVRRRFGLLGAVLAALSLAVFPSFVAVSRDNNVDAVLILLMVLSCGAALRAIDMGRLRWLLASGALVALAFNTKALAACIVIPGILVAYGVCAPLPARRRVRDLAVAGGVCAVLSLAWMVAVDATPSTQRPFVGSTTDNSELGLTFAYNGFGRFGGQANGPGATPELALVPALTSIETALPRAHAVNLPRPAPGSEPDVAALVTRGPVSFGRPPGPFRLFRDGFADQGAWLLVLAIAGLIALALTRPARRDPRLAALIVFGGFFLGEAVFLSFSRGIVHPYYVSALGPGVAFLVGAGAAVTAERWRGPWSGLFAAAALLSALLQLALMHHSSFLGVWQVLLAPAVLALCAFGLMGRLPARATVAAVTGVLLVAPAAYSATTWKMPVQGTFPAAGPNAVEGQGGVGLSRGQQATNTAIVRYVLSHGASSRYQLLTEASLTADGPILLGLRAAAMGGYGGIDPALDGPGLARLVASGQARYVLLGGSYAYLGGNAAAVAAAANCPQVPLKAWRGAGAQANNGFYLLDCAGRADALARAPGT